ncbi:flagellar basal body P-ring formation chaperone FlgA [Paraglaciecola polaris]|uniref:flagellar basal body P-ring formation chaperone FlgA n=1 Tax=Paraglaciecola polaris TaxID=222814 RepID=UPI0030EC37D1|tara:strand:- start:5383 stop:6093 length:711 start_codon:yes stop_codon:yes gene_type:complete
MNNMTIYKVLPLFTLLAMTSSAVFASPNTHQNRAAQLIDGAQEYVASQITTSAQSHLNISTAEIDQRVNLPVCPAGVSYSASPDSLLQSNIAVKASCDQSNWYMYLMVNVKQMQPVVVISNAVSPGTILNSGNIKLVDMNRALLRRTTFSSVEEVLGARIKRRVRPGQPITPNNLCFVCKGDTIIINASNAVMQVKATGVAMQDGNIGDTINVTNSRSKKQINARVASINEVIVGI